MMLIVFVFIFLYFLLIHYQSRLSFSLLKTQIILCAYDGILARSPEDHFKLVQKTSFRASLFPHPS